MQNQTAKTAKWIGGGICVFLLVIIILIFSFHTSILIQAGRFMAPQGDYNADVAIMEGSNFLDTDTDLVLIRGMNLLISGKVKRLIAVLHSDVSADRSSVLKGDYPKLVKKKLESLGLKETDFRIIETPSYHPVTLTQATVVLETISKEQIKSAILLSRGFHTRRSYLVYQYIGLPVQIKIYPYACLDLYEPLDGWWSQQHGRHYFVLEILKLTYYMGRGYIPWKLSY